VSAQLLLVRVEQVDPSRPRHPVGPG